MNPGRQDPGAAAPVHSITGARDAHSQDFDVRVRRYLISMGIRTVCVVLAVVVPGPLRWVFIAGAVLLPYVAVIMANASTPRRRSAGPTAVTRVALPAQAAPLVVDLGRPEGAGGDRPRTGRSAEWLSSPSGERPT